MAIAHHHGYPVVGSPASMSLQVLLHFVFNGGLQQLAGAFGDDLFQRAFDFNFCSLRERDHFSFFQRRILSVAVALSEAAAVNLITRRMRPFLSPHPQLSVIPRSRTRKLRPQRCITNSPSTARARPPFTLSRKSRGYGHFCGLRSGLPGSHFPPLIAASSALAALPSARITER